MSRRTENVLVVVGATLLAACLAALSWGMALGVVL